MNTYTPETNTKVAGPAIPFAKDFYYGQHWLAAHNAWNTNQNPWNNQNYTITELLNYGVRGFALDIYGTNESDLHLQHGHDNPATSIKWSIILNKLKTWLAKNPNEIVTLLFESYLTGPKTKGQACALASLDNTLKDPVNGIPSYVSGKEEQLAAINGKRLSELIKEDKRLFAFIEREPDEGTQTLFPTMLANFAENVYGNRSLYANTWNDLRDDPVMSSYKAPMTFLNHFGDSGDINVSKVNAVANLEKHAKSYIFSYQGRVPNFISLDKIICDDKNKGPIEVIAAIRNLDDVQVSPYTWVGQNDLDDYLVDIANSKIVNLTATTDSNSIISITAERSNDENAVGIIGIQVVNEGGKGVVNMRFKVAGMSHWGGWLTSFRTIEDRSNPDLATHESMQEMVGICCRTQSGYGVTDIAIAFAAAPVIS